MKKAPNIRLSLRKLLIATMAVGPLAVLPAPVWAVLPTYNSTTNTGSFTVANGTAAVTAASGVANINVSDRAVLVWGNNTTGAASETLTDFNIGSGETYNFVLPSNGAVLNRVKTGTATAPNNPNFVNVGAYVAGSLLSNGKVFILSDTGNISVVNGAVINTQGGLVLSTLAENNNAFITTGDLAYTGTSTANITIGTATVTGNLSATANLLTSIAPTSVTGDMVLRSIGSAQAITLGTTTVTGNLSATSNNAVITQNGGTSILVGATGGNQTTTLSSGTGSITLGSATNDFKTVAITSSGTSDVTLGDANIVTLAASTIGRDLTVVAGGQTNTTAIASSGTLAIGGNASFTSIATNNSGINIANNSTIGGTVNATTAGGAITINTTGNLTTGAISSNNLTGLGTQSVQATAAGTQLTVGLQNIPVATGGAGYASAPTVVIAAPPAGGTQATATATVVGGVVTGITITDAGAGYTSIPAVSLTGGTPTTAATLGSTAIQVLTANITTSGAGVFATAPAITFTAAPLGGTNATGNVVASTNTTTGVAGGAVTIANGGAGYTTIPTLTVAAPLTNAAINITTTGALNLTNSILASHNATAPAVNITGGSVVFGAAGAINNQGPVTINSTAGNITLGTISANRLNATAVGGDIGQLAATAITTNHTGGTSAFNAGTGNITLNLLNPFANGATVQFTGNNVDFRSTNNIALGTTNATGNVSLLAAASPAGNKNIVLGTGIGTGVGQQIRVGNVLTVTASGTGNITDNDYSLFDVFGGLNLTTGSGAITLDAATAIGALSPVVKFGQINASTTGAVTLVETSTLNLGNVSAGATLNARSIDGGVIDTGNVTVATGGTASLRASSDASVNLDGANNVFANLNFGGGVDNSVTNLNSNVTISGATTGTGTITVGTNGTNSITLGSANITGNLTLISGGGFDVAGNAAVTGDLTLTTTGNLTSALAGFTPTATQTAGALTAVTGTNLGSLTFATAPTVTLTGGGATTQGTATATLGANGQITGFNVTSGGAGYTSNPTVTLSGGSLTGITETAGSLAVSGNTTVQSSGDVNLFRGNDFTAVTMNASSRNVVLNDVSSLTVSGTTNGTLTATSGGEIPVGGVAGSPVRIANPWTLTFGNLAVNSLVATASNGGGGFSGAIAQQFGTRISSNGLTSLNTSDANIVLGNNGNNFGRVEITVAERSRNNTVTVVEDGFLRLGNLNSRGGTTLTSRFGSVIEDAAANVEVINNGTLTVNAVNGNILLGNTTHTSGTTTGNVVTFVGNAPTGNVAIQSSNNLALGNITAASLTAKAGTNHNLTQSGRLSIFGATDLSAARAITMNNTTNSFGRLTLATTNATTGNIEIVESGTVNLGTVTMAAAATANFTATSVNGDIIDSGLGNVKIGGTTSSLGTGVATLTASNGNIMIDDATTDFASSGGVVFNANNVTISTAGPLVLGANNTTSTATNLTASTSTITTASISNNGALNVSGDASFQTVSADITLNQSQNRFGTVRFNGRAVSITQINDINLLTGSSATGAASFNSTGSYITIENRGGGSVALSSTGLFTAVGSIVLPNLIQAVGQITVNSSSEKNLGALSLLGNLGGLAPQNLGTGTYIAPQP